MVQYRFLVFSNPIEGREEEYEDWYTNQHISDVVRTASARGLKNPICSSCAAGR